jgi:hypothetical protein
MYEHQINLDCKVSITANYEHGVKIELHDEKSGITFAEVTLTNEQFVYAALNRLQRVPAQTAIVYHLDKVGLKCERKYITLDIIHLGHKHDSGFKESVLNYITGRLRVDYPGWYLNDSLSSPGSIRYVGNKVLSSFNIVRWVSE